MPGQAHVRGLERGGWHAEHGCATLPPAMSDGAAPAVTRTARPVFEALASRRFVVVSGKGGVGRTTVAAMIGRELATRGAKVLVATTGHDDRLAWMMGASTLTDRPVRAPSGVFVQRLFAPTCIREYGALVMRSARVSSLVFDNRVVAKLMRAIPGLDDFSLVGKAWHEAFRGGEYDVVVFDGPATGHLLYTLGVPRAILSTIAPGPLTREAELMQKHLTDPAQSCAVLVGLPERWPLTELDELAGALGRDVGIGVAGVFVNGMWPAQAPAVTTVGDPAVAALIERARRVTDVGERQRDELEQWRASTQTSWRAVIGLPWRFDGIAGPDALASLAAAATSIDQAGAVSPEVSP